MEEITEKSALDYHRFPRPGKLEIVPTKALGNQRDLALAYSPGVANACEAIAASPADASLYTARSNLVAVVTNGTAVLGLGSIGPLASKPVMEGKAVLFKKFAGIDVFDLEVDEKDSDRLIDIVCSLEPTFGGINLEDISAPHCFYIEERLRERMRIPVFHDDQHGTAIIAAAAVRNGLRIADKELGEIRLVCVGGGAAGIACLRLLVHLGLPRENVVLVDRSGVVHVERTGRLDKYKRLFATRRPLKTLGDALRGADVFLGLSGPGVLKQEMVRSMGEAPLILALANPIPEILPEEARAVRPDAIVATGRSDYPNQVNNVLCFPFIFRGALDVGATTINREMMVACMRALADIAFEASPDTVLAAYGESELRFGPDYLIPKPFDPRLITQLAPAVAQAAMDSGVATRPIPDLEGYRRSLSRYVYSSIMVMRPVFERARSQPRRLVYPEGGQDQVLRAVQAVIDEGVARPIVLGNPDRIANRLKHMLLRMRPGRDVEVIDPGADDSGPPTSEHKRIAQRTRAAVRMLRAGEADGLVCGLTGRFRDHLKPIVEELGMRPGIRRPAALSVVVLKRGAYFFCDTAVQTNPDAGDLDEIARLAVESVRRFGIEPRVALVSHRNGEAGEKGRLRDALKRIRRSNPELEVDGPLRADTALVESLRQRVRPDSRLTGEANLFVFPGRQAARIAYDLVKVLGDGVSIGPILLGLNSPVHVLTPSATVRRVLNASALAVVDAQRLASQPVSPVPPAVAG